MVLKQRDILFERLCLVAQIQLPGPIMRIALDRGELITQPAQMACTILVCHEFLGHRLEGPLERLHAFADHYAVGQIPALYAGRPTTA